MATLTFQMPDGSSSSATVDDSVMSMPAAQQQQTIDEIHQHALAANAASNSYTNDFKSAASGAMNDAGSLMQGVGSALGSDTVKGWGTSLRGAAPVVPAGYQNRGGNFLNDLTSGNYGTAVGDLTHGVAGGSVESVGELGAGVAGGILSGGNPLGAAAGAGLVGGAFALGRGGRLRAGQNATSGSDLAAAAPAALATGAVDAATMGRIPGGMLGRTAAMAAGGGANSAIGQYDATGSVDPRQVANDAAVGGVTGALAEAPSALKNVGGNLATNLQSRGADYQPTSDAAGQANIRAGNDLQARMAAADAAPGKSPSLTQLANQQKTEYKGRVQDAIDTMKTQGADKDALTYAQGLQHDAGVHNSTLNEAGLDTLQNMDHGLSDDQFSYLRDRMNDLQAISEQSIQNKQVGPISAIAGKIAPLATAGGLLYAGHPIGALESLAFGKNESAVGRLVGSLGDKALGTQNPALVLKAMAAQRKLGDVAPGATSMPDQGAFVSPADALNASKATATQKASDLKQTSTASRLRQAVQAQAQADSAMPVSKPLAAPPVETPVPLVGKPLQAPAVQPASQPVSQPLPAPPIQAPLQGQPMAAPPVQAPVQGSPLAPPPVQRPMQGTPMQAPPVQAPMQGTPMAPPPVQRPMQGTPMAPPPVQLAANGVAPRAPLAPPPVVRGRQPVTGPAGTQTLVFPERQPDPLVASQPQAKPVAEPSGAVTRGPTGQVQFAPPVPTGPATRLAQAQAAALDTHGRPINNQAAFDGRIQAYRADAIRASMQADQEMPGLGDVVTSIMDAHHPGYADPNLPPAAQAAARADTRQKTLAMKRGMAEAAIAMATPAQKHIVQKYMTPALLNHG